MPDTALHEWRMRCVGWQPNADGDPRRLGYADLALSGGMVLRNVSLFLTAAGPIRAAAPHLHRRGPASFTFGSNAEWHDFSAAVVNAVRAAFPRALPDAPAEPATRPAPGSAPANKEFAPCV